MTTSQILKLTRQLLPTGRAFRTAINSWTETLYKGLGRSESTAVNAGYSLMDSLMPDSSRFTEEDATDWERRLGLITNLDLDLDSRKAAILRKMSNPGTNPAKSSYRYLQAQLRAAGFDVYVHENIIYDYPSGTSTHNPADLNINILSQVQSGDHQHGNVQHGYYLNHLIVNSIYNNQDVAFDTGGTLRTTFFIGGQILGTMASIPATREQEFRQLVLTLKRVPSVAILFIQYT